MSWTLAVAILLTAALTGRIADAVLHKHYNTTIKNWLYLRAVQFDEYTYIGIFHNNISKIDFTLTKLFGTSIADPKSFIFTVGILSLSFIFGGPMASAIGLWTRFGMYIYSGSIFVLSLIVLRLLIYTTKRILRRTRPTLSSVMGWLIMEVIVVLLALPIPIGVATFIYSYPKGLDIALQLSAFTGVVSIAHFFGPIADPSILLTFSADNLVITILIASIVAPITYCIILGILDVIIKLIIKPLSIFLSKLFEYIEQERQPVTWILATFGAVPSVVKAWTEVLLMQAN